MHLPCTPLGCRRKPEDPEETHTDVGECAHSTRTVVLAWKQFFFSPQSYNGTMLNEMTLFKNLLYVAC